MATKLDKDLIRESSEIIDGREIIVTLSEDQSIKFKLKGMKSGEVSINIKELYNQLSGYEEIIKEEPSISIVHKEEEPKSGILIDLNDLRSMNAISTLDTPTLVKFDGLIADLIKQNKEVADAMKNVQRKSLNKKKK
jgi:hypothetical protein